ncbi:MAG: synthase subunit gamma [Bacteroidota bacterium]|jgi:F-type H+-transporting ATPase subunit gamma
MASLKEVKDRIASVKSTRKITSAMKMIAASKLRKSQHVIESFSPYSSKLNDILINLLASDQTFDSVYAQQREVKNVIIIAFSSNTSLCGAFNANIIKEVSSTISEYKKKMPIRNITVYPIGKKVARYVDKVEQNSVQHPDYLKMSDKPSFSFILDLSKELTTKFLEREVDEIVLVYTHFHSTGVQKVVKSVHLPFNLEEVQQRILKDDNTKKVLKDYILEPSKAELLALLIPKVLASNLFAALLDSNASENAARSLAMQIATDNANDLVQDLTIEYNKNRQAAITNELLDIIGGAAALS